MNENSDSSRRSFLKTAFAVLAAPMLSALPAPAAEKTSRPIWVRAGIRELKQAKIYGGPIFCDDLPVLVDGMTWIWPDSARSSNYDYLRTYKLTFFDEGYIQDRCIVFPEDGSPSYIVYKQERDDINKYRVVNVS